MSDAGRQSPRIAIRNWLYSIDNNSSAKPANVFPEQRKNERDSRHHPRRHHTTRHASEKKDGHSQEAGRKHQRHNKNETRQKRVTDKDRLVNSHQAKPQTHRKEKIAVHSDGLGLAERLGLHAPFRTFKDHSDDDIEAQGRPLKRRRSRSFTSSYLEPAAANDLSDNDLDRASHAPILRIARTGPALGDSGEIISPTASQDLEMSLPSPEKLLKSYERRPRHKTRQDRYELKGNNRDSEKARQAAKRDRGRKKQKKQKRREKSGAALMHGFAAQNVAHDRLTLKPAKTLGLFGKGRASSPVRRRGLPDLAFSELTFLTSRREKPRDSFEDSSNRPSDKKKRRKSTRAADAEAEFSRYFMSAKPTSHNVTSSHGQRYQQDTRRSRDHESPQVELTKRPFLGFGSCGPNTSTSPVKISVKTDSRHLHCADSRSATRSTSYLTWSQSGGPSYASPPSDRRHHFEPLTSSKLSNRKRTSQGPYKGQHPIPPVSTPCVQETSSGTQGAAPGPCSKHQNANEATRQDSESWLATGERHRSREKDRHHSDSGTTELDAAKPPQDAEDSVPDNTRPVEATRHEDPEPALSSRNQAACKSSGHEPQCEPGAHDVRPLLAQMPITSPHKDRLDNLLDALLQDCNSTVDCNDPVPRATLNHRSSHVSEEASIPSRTQGRSRMPARACVDRSYASEAPMSALDCSTKPCNASLQQVSGQDHSRTTHALSRGSLHASNRPSLGYNRGYPPIPTQSQVDSTNAWNDYSNLYKRQQEQAGLLPGTLREHLPSSFTAVQDDISGPSRGTGHVAAPDRYAPDLHPADVVDDIDGYRPDPLQILQEGNENGNYQEIGHDEWDDRFIDHRSPYNSGGSIFNGSSDGYGHGFVADNIVNDAGQQREIQAIYEQSLAQGADQHEIAHQLFTTNIPDNYSSWRPQNMSNVNYRLERSAASAQVHDVDPGLCGFWTPHKLY